MISTVLIPLDGSPVAEASDSARSSAAPRRGGGHLAAGGAGARPPPERVDVDARGVVRVGRNRGRAELDPGQGACRQLPYPVDHGRRPDPAEEILKAIARHTIEMVAMTTRSWCSGAGHVW